MFPGRHIRIYGTKHTKNVCYICKGTKFVHFYRLKKVLIFDQLFNKVCAFKKKSRFQVFEKANFAAVDIGRDRQFIFFIF